MLSDIDNNKNIVLDKNILGYFRSFNYKIEFRLNTSDFKALYKSCADTVNNLKSQKTINSEPVLTNIKGIDRINFAKTESEALKYEQQLFSYDISYKTADEKIQHLNYSIVTPFHSFKSADINHSLKVISDNGIQLTLDSPLTNSELELLCFQFGLEQFGMSKFSNWFFKTPVVLESVFIEAFQDKLSIFFQAEVLPKNLMITEHIKPISAKLHELFGYNLLEDLKQSIPD